MRPVGSSSEERSDGLRSGCTTLALRVVAVLTLWQAVGLRELASATAGGRLVRGCAGAGDGGPVATVPNARGPRRPRFLALAANQACLNGSRANEEGRSLATTANRSDRTLRPLQAPQEAAPFEVTLRCLASVLVGTVARLSGASAEG